MATEPAISPDGSRVAYYSIADAMDLYTVNADGSDLKRLTSDGAKYRSPQWSPDGRSIALHTNRGGNYQIWTVDAAGKTFKQITNTGTITIYPFWSPKGDRVGYVDLGHGVSSVSLANIKAGSEMMIAGDLMVRPAWSPDGEKIAGTLPPAAGGTGIVVYTLATRAMEKVSPIGDAPQWLPDSKRFVFVWRNKLYLEDLATHKSSEILNSDRDQLALGSVSRDGKWIYFARTVTEADLWSMEPRH
jgi:Tol biopolymer transport system component